MEEPFQTIAHTMKRPIEFNSAEAILAIFWDPDISEMDSWALEPLDGTSVETIRQWDSFRFNYVRSNLESHAFSLEKKALSWSISSYDKLLLQATFPRGTVVEIVLLTEKGVIEKTFEPYESLGRELALDLKGCASINSMKIIVSGGNGLTGAGTIKWIGVQNSERLKAHLAMFSGYDPAWQGLLKDNSFKPSFNPTYNLIVSAVELETIRKTQLEIDWETVDRIMALEPEKLISDYVNFWDDTRYERERDFFKRLTRDGVTIAETGVLLKDEKMVRMGCRIALSLLMCRNWYDSFMANFPIGTWEHRGFVPSIIAYEIGTVMDLAGEFFTNVATNMFLRRLSENAMGTINFAIWKHEYMFHNNQLSWFTYGRLLAYCIISHHYPRARKYMELAVDEVKENLNNIMMDDGGYGEGPSYFTCIAQHAMKGLYFYSRYSKEPLEKFIPERLRHTHEFVELITSTDDSQEVLPICDGHDHVNLETNAFMAMISPDSFWSVLLDEALGRERVFSSLILENLIQGRKKYGKNRKNFIAMPFLGSAMSYRVEKEKELKIFMMGNKANTDHAHEDKGSFIIEYDRKTYAMDSGTADYANSISSLLQLADRHNMLIPYGTGSRPHPNRPNLEDIAITGSGDETSFSMHADLSSDWPGFYKKWKRSIISNEFYTLSIYDEWSLEKGVGVEFLWNTILAVEEKVSSVIVGGNMEICIDEGCSYRIFEREYPKGRIQYTIAIRKACTEGHMQTDIRILQ